MLYEIYNLVKKYEDRTVLDIDSLNINKGRVYGLLGPNGAGKTTLLEILAFILKPDRGELYFNGNLFDHAAPGNIGHRKNVVLVQQHPVLFTTNVFRNVEFPLKIRKIEKSKRKKTVDELLSMMGMTEFGNALGHTLSGGETQRIAIAQALACSPDVILLDEPTSSVDIENRAGIESIIKKINRDKGITVIFTSHDMLQVSRLADEIIYISNGKISDTIHENIFSGRIVRNNNGSFIEIQEKIRFRVKTLQNESARISIDPLKIKIKKDKNIDIISDHQFKGRLMQLTDEGDRIRIHVDINIPLILLIEKEKYSISELCIGDKVIVEFPEDSIMFI
ncbi:MAG: ATP-binding cassette domain-containing protein [Deltaproteobacteria bacterium]|nr:ATP-binding cassette domain-containing protein [Deltaproteobacteria bacterium]